MIISYSYFLVNKKIGTVLPVPKSSVIAKRGGAKRELRRRVFLRRTADLFANGAKINVSVRLAPKFISDHALIRDNRDADGLLLNLFNQIAEIAITGKQNNMINFVGDLEHVHRNFDVHIALGAGLTSFVIGHRFHGLGDHRISIVREKVGEGANGGIFFTIRNCGVVICSNKLGRLSKKREKLLIVDADTSFATRSKKIRAVDKSNGAFIFKTKIKHSRILQKSGGMPFL